MQRSPGKSIHFLGSAAQRSYAGKLDLAKEVKKGCADENMVGLVFNTIGIR